MAKLLPSDGCEVIRGPFSLFDDSFVVEFLKPRADFNSSILMRFTYKAGNPTLKLGKKHPLVPPLHLHWSQIESFQVVQGSFGVTYGYDLKDIILTPSNTPFDIERWVPHTVWPDPATATSSEDAVALLWAHPDCENSIDHVFFESLFRYLDECHREKKNPNLFQMVVTQHPTDTAFVLAPGASFLGPLRWGFPWAVFSAINAVGRTLGYTPAIKKYLAD